MSDSRKLNPEAAGKRHERAKGYDLFLQLDISEDEPPRIVEKIRRTTEFHEDIVTRFRNEWQTCRSQLTPERPSPVGQVTVDIHLTKRPKHLTHDEGLLLLGELAAGVRAVFLGGLKEPPPIDLPFARGELRFQHFPAADQEALATGQQKTDDASLIEDALPACEDRLPSPEETIKDLVAELIPTLSPEAEEKAWSIITFNRTLNRTYWQELRGVAEPLIISLLVSIPADIEGKRRRATLINALLTALDRGILYHDQQGRPHVCSVQASQARTTDHTGNFRLRRRTNTAGSQRTFPLPPLDQLQIVETSHQEPEGHGVPSRKTERT